MQAPKLSGKQNRHRKYTGRGPRADRNELHRLEAADRDAAWRALTPQQQVDDLDRRLGKDEGARRQRARLTA
jgi:hypothetical protein